MALRKGTAGVNTLRGTSGIDTLLGLGGNDTLLGLAGKDRLDGGTGRDRMVGGDGNDLYIVDRRDDIIVESKGDGTDTVQSKATFTLPKNVENLTLTGKADIDGTGNGQANVITGNAGENTLVGSGGNDTLIGAGDKDRLLGGDGNDRLDGGTGADRMEGGEGNDTYIFGVGDKIIEGTGNGTDTIRTTVTITSAQANVEVIRLDGAEAINAVGDGKPNRIFGNGGANRLDGGGGADSLVGGGGNDSLLGGTGADELDGGAGNDTLEGGDADDTVIGGSGDDTVNGSGGADILIGGDGSDLIVIDDAGDRAAGGEGLSLVPAGIASLARLSAPFAALNGVGDMDEIRSATLSLDLATMVPEDDFEIARLEGDLDLNVIGDPASANEIMIFGNAGANTLIGQNGDDTLDGGAGADRLVGGTGDDTYVVDNVGDVPVEEADEGNDTIVVTNDANLINFANFENINGAGNADLILLGDDNVNVISGGDGNDSIFGAGGDDSLDGGAGDDKLEGQAGNDSIAGDEGIDRARFGGNLADYTVAVTNGVITVTDDQPGVDGDDGIDTLTTIETLDFFDQIAHAPMDLGGLDETTGFKIIGENANDFAGRSVHGVGDVNGDGFGDVIVGANFNDGGGVDAGAIYVVFGKASGFGTINLDDIAAGDGGFKVEGEFAGDFAGTSVATAGDVNGDGLADLIVGAYLSGAGGPQSGAAYVVFGTNEPLTTLSLGDIGEGDDGFKIIGEEASDVAGLSVASAGDFNGDGFDDVIIGARGNDTGGNAAGAAYVVFGKASGFNDVNLDNVALGVGGIKIIGENAGDYAGSSVSSAGDIDGDGFDDIVIGAFLEDTSGASAGAAYVVFGKASGLGTVDLDDVALGTGGFKIVGEAANDRAGLDVSAAGDFDGDGFLDIVIGAYRNSAGGLYAGAAYVVFGKDTGFGTVNLDDVALGAGGFKIIGETTNNFAGGNVASAGDVNGDGKADLLVGSTRNDAGANDSGAAYIIFGTSGAPATVNLDDIARGVGGVKLFGEDAVDLAGVSLSGAGDLNGDGFDDIVVGAYRNDAGGADAGAGYVIFGRDFTETVTHLGTENDDILTGDADDNILVGGRGYDTLDGGDGDDILIGGAQDDLLIFDPLDEHRVDGGLGFDTLVITSAGGGLDLTAINVDAHYNLYQNIEGIDLTGTGDNGVALDLIDLLRLSDHSNVLRVDGDVGDHVDGGGGWTQHANVVIDSTTYAFFTQGGATLQVSVDVDQTNIDVSVFDFEGIADFGGIKIIGENAADISGRSVASAGDINGDGFADVIVGAYLNDAGGTNAGAAYVVFGKADGLANVNLDDIALGLGGFKIIGESGADYAGFSVSSAGDINGDGFADIFVGAYQNDAGALRNGAAYIIFGKDTGFATVNLDDVAAGIGGLGFKIVGESDYDLAGRAVASAGDVNGDGLSDIILGAYQDDDVGSDSGAAYVVFGKTTGFGTVLLADVAAGDGGFKLDGEAESAEAGFRVASAGDVNGDGFADVLVSSLQDGAGGAQAGATYLVFGAPIISGTISLGLAAAGTGGFKIIGEDTRDFAGYSVAAAGDVDGDGLDDIVIGADYADSAGADSGAAYVIFGTTTPPPGGVNLDDIALGLGGFKITGEATNDFAGVSVAGAGDVNGDGIQDVIVGANGNGAGPNAGAAYVVFGKATGFTTVSLDEVAEGIGGFKMFGENGFAEFGKSVAGAGDVDGDGFDDLIIGAYGDFAGGNAAGASYVFFGRDFTKTVTHLGTDGDDDLVGDASKNILIGGQGNDTLAGGADDDVLIGGSGDDVLIFDAADMLNVDGGGGEDKLKFEGAGLSLNLTTVNASEHYNLYTGIEIIDLTGSGANSLNLDIQDLFHLSEESNTLRVDGDGDDAITTSDAGWGVGDPDADIVGYTSYTNGNATLIVQTDIIQSGVQA